jgi:alkaline phosphatase D
MDFTPVDGGVMDAPFTDPDADNFVEEPNNVAAVGSITIYRNFRWGANVDLIITDLRSYRSDHAILEEEATPPLFFDPRNVLPKDMVLTFDQGMTANGGNPPTTVDGYPNPRTASPVGTMLGATQKQWWKDTMMASTATWKLWANEVMLIRCNINNVGGSPGLLGVDRIMDGDAWDGYPTERAELMGFLLANDIENVVALSGDIHATFAGVIVDDPDSATPTPVATELVVAGISSNSLFSFYEAATRPPIPAQLRQIVTVDASSTGGSAFTPTLNMTLLHGTGASVTFAGSLDLATAQAAYDPTINPNLLYADADSQGYGYAKVTATEITGVMTIINRPIMTPSNSGPGILRTATFTIPAGNPAGMTGPTMTGTKPFPMT